MELGAESTWRDHATEARPPRVMRLPLHDTRETGHRIGVRRAMKGLRVVSSIKPKAGELYSHFASGRSQ